MMQKKCTNEVGATQIPAVGFLRMRQIIGDKERGIIGIIPVSRSGWYQGVRDGRFPAPVRLMGRKAVAWRAEDIRDLVAQLGRKEQRG
jgi:predicted DNA-binding transcriptional regulator AlpA